jgi:hypothetical protein
VRGETSFISQSSQRSYSGVAIGLVVVFVTPVAAAEVDGVFAEAFAGVFDG